MNMLSAALLLAILAGSAYTEDWEDFMKTHNRNLWDHFHRLDSDISKSVDDNIDQGFDFNFKDGIKLSDATNGVENSVLLQDVNQGSHFSFGDPSTQSQDVIQEGQSDVTLQNVIQGPSFHYGDKSPSKPLQTQKVHQQGKGLVVVQNVVQGPSVHVPKYDFPQFKNTFDWKPWSR